jgi:hypothetical protein
MTETAARLHARYHYGAVTERPRQAVTSACPRRPLRVQPQRLKRRAHGARLRPRLRALNGPIPYTVRMTLEAARAPGSKNLTLEECELLTSGLEARSAGTSATGALDLKKTTDQRFEGQPSWEPPKPADAKGRGHLAATPRRPY